MHTQTTKTFRHVTDEKSATLSRSRWYRIRTTTDWTFLVFELAEGSLWRRAAATIIPSSGGPVW
jgi:hypothetical protein